MVNFLSWNVRGLNSQSRKLVVRSLLRKWKCDIISLQETKIEIMTSRIVGETSRNREVDWVVLGACGTAGGIVTMWDSSLYEKVDMWEGIFSVSCLLRRIVDGVEWVVTGVYGPNADASRVEFWEELKSIRSRWSALWLLVGDFNVVRFPLERRGVISNNQGMEGFSEFINDCGLLDPPLVGSCFTWARNEESSAVFRLDRFLLSHDWDDLYLDVSQVALERVISDHIPILLRCGPLRSVRRPFRFVLSTSANTPGRYAGIVIDLFSEGKVLQQLQEATTWVELNNRLMPNGRLMVNCGGSIDGTMHPKTSSTDGSWLPNSTIKALWTAFPEQLNWKKLPEKEGENYLALTGPLPDLNLWSSTLPDRLSSSVKQWKSYE